MVATITEDDILDRVGEQSFERGVQYHRSGMIFDPRRQGATLKARCRGSSGGPYRVEATLAPEGVISAHCSCPVGSGGYCKHVAALLLTWQAQPEQFGEQPELDDVLERRTKAELIALIRQMLRQEPELEWLLDTPLPATGKTRRPVDPATYRRQAAALFDNAEYEWGVEGEMADGLLAIKEIGDGFLAQQDSAGAAAVYGAILEPILKNYNTFEDESGDLSGVLIQCVTGLGQCLPDEALDPKTRAAILRQLWEVYRFDVDSGGRSLGDDAADLLLDQTNPEERHTIVGWVREALPEGDSWSDNWHRQVYGGFLLDLEADTLDDETFLRICREMGRSLDLVDRLLSLSRIDESVEAASEASDYELIGLADLFVEHNQGEIADRLMQERSEKSDDSRIVEWLKKRALARDDRSTALDLAQRIFRKMPSLQEYREIRELARSLDRWEALRPELLAHAQQSPHSELLIRIYLDEGEIDQALEAVKTRPRSWGGYYGQDIRLDVADAAAAARPRAALEIFREEAERRIAERGRGNYQYACVLLRKVRDLYAQLEESGVWTAYVTALREQNRSLRALKEELEAAGL